MKDLKLSSNIIHNYEAESDIYICCFLDDNADSIIELTGLSRTVFGIILQGEATLLEPTHGKVIEKLIELGIVCSEQIDQDNTSTVTNLNKESTPEIEELGIKIKTYDELYSPELAAYGFTTLTATNSSSYCDCS